MAIVVVGSVAFDSLETPYGKREQALGGSANYFSLSAAFFSQVKLCAIIGEDFPEDHVKQLKTRGIDTAGLVTAPGKTFHWKGRYGLDLNEAQTLDTQLNVFAGFDPLLPESYRKAETVFLANIDPDLQRKVLEQVESPRLVAMDSMNLWIDIKKDALQKTMKGVDIVFMNETECRLFSGEHNIVKAARAIQRLGGRHGSLSVVVKRGEYGALCFRDEHISFVPAFPLEDVFDPTGAGDTFAGGFIGWLDRNLGRGEAPSDALWRRGMVMGTVMASFVVEQFSFDRMLPLTHQEIGARWQRLHQLSAFEGAIDLV
jgi:sugar/nucleoside kinase (ribokinase family)